MKRKALKFGACLVCVFKNWKLLFKNICGNTCGWKSVLKCVKCCLKTENGCLKSQTKHPLEYFNIIPLFALFCFCVKAIEEILPNRFPPLFLQIPSFTHLKSPWITALFTSLLQNHRSLVWFADLAAAWVKVADIWVDVGSVDICLLFCSNHS